MKQSKISVSDRKVTTAALAKAEETSLPAAAIELADGRIITAKTSNLLGASAALILNALKELAGINHETDLISPLAIEPIQALKVEYLGSKNPRLHSDEVLIALAMSAKSDENAALAMKQLPKLKNCAVHTTTMLTQVDKKTFAKLGCDVTSEPKRR